MLIRDVTHVGVDQDKRGVLDRYVVWLFAISSRHAGRQCWVKQVDKLGLFRCELAIKINATIPHVQPGELDANAHDGRRLACRARCLERLTKHSDE